MDDEPEMSEAMECCPDCGRIISREAAACPKCGHFFGLGRRMKRAREIRPGRSRIGWAWGGIIGAIVITGLLIYAGVADQQKYQGRKASIASNQSKIIDYRLLWNKQNQYHDKYGNYYQSLEMVILVAETATKSEALALANRLDSQFKEQAPSLHLRIYDSEKIAMEYVRMKEEEELFDQGKISREQLLDENWVSRGAEMSKHLLLTMNRMPWNDNAQLDWIGRGRDH